ncbi:Futsch light chain LC(f) like [Actinidia chinensis var. chinensis]|uniref:Futsch light chain LC(F) like n=1 Tax=Actinidia chinensis var. chinensis TaxID=1590841 RepID=A0A2R6PLP0_ACTCC|nr:Futsch light chain LC(f) like [Actinidia chinensis var. chinensis]
MSRVEGFFILDSENGLVGDKPEAEKATKASFGSAGRKSLGGKSNLPQPKPSSQLDKEQLVSNTIKEYIDQLQKENMTLMKLLGDRKYPFDDQFVSFSKIVELSGIELKKLRVGLQKMQQQNLQLAQANSQMLMELNSGKDRLKALHHERGCKNGLLKAKEIELEEKAKIRRCQKVDNQVGTSKSDGAVESSESDRAENIHLNTKRKKQSKSLGPSTLKQVQLKEKNENKRVCSRRQSARFKSEDPEPTEDVFGIDDAKSKEKRENKRVCTRRQSARFKSEEVEPTEDPFEIDDVKLKGKNENKSVCLRRQSARFKSEELEPTEDVFEIDDAQFPVCPLHDGQMQEDGSISMSSSVKNDDKEGSSALSDEVQQLRRSSIGRPLRLASKKVQSYKETPLNIKLRRTE